MWESLVRLHPSFSTIADVKLPILTWSANGSIVWLLFQDLTRVLVLVLLLSRYVDRKDYGQRLTHAGVDKITWWYP